MIFSPVTRWPEIGSGIEIAIRTNAPRTKVAISKLIYANCVKLKVTLPRLQKISMTLNYEIVCRKNPFTGQENVVECVCNQLQDNDPSLVALRFVVTSSLV